MTTDPRELVVEADDGVALHVEVDEGPGPAHTIVFSHGIAAASRVWSVQRAALRGRARIVVWDQRGHGRSGRGASRNATVAQTARDLRAVVEATTSPRDRVVLVGHSLGGMSAMALAREAPELVRYRVAGVVLVATAAGDLGTCGAWASVYRLLTSTGLLTASLVCLRLAAPLVGRLFWRDCAATRWAVERFLFDDDLDPRATSEALSSLTVTSWPAVVDFLPDLVVFDGLTDLPLLTGVPVTVLAAAHDRILPSEHSRRVVEALGPSARLLELPGTGHCANLTCNGQVAYAVRMMIANDGPVQPEPVAG